MAVHLFILVLEPWRLAERVTVGEVKGFSWQVKDSEEEEENEEDQGPFMNGESNSRSRARARSTHRWVEAMQ